jgi:hypothetical protein
VDSKWDELFPEDPEKLLDLTEESIQSLLEGVKHYNVQVPLAEVLNRLIFKEFKLKINKIRYNVCKDLVSKD